jgi:hypothetical protein
MCYVRLKITLRGEVPQAHSTIELRRGKARWTLLEIAANAVALRVRHLKKTGFVFVEFLALGAGPPRGKPVTVWRGSIELRVVLERSSIARAPESCPRH